MCTLLRLLAVTSLSVALASPLAAQSARAGFGDLSIGLSNRTGGDYMHRSEYTAELLLGGRLMPRMTAALVGGVAIGGTFVNGTDLTCRISPLGGCVPEQPRFAYLSTLVGAETQGRLGGVSVMAGPSLARFSHNYRLGAQLRADLISPSLARLALVVSPRLLFVPGVGDATLSLRSVSVGLRIR